MSPCSITYRRPILTVRLDLPQASSLFAPLCVSSVKPVAVLKGTTNDTEQTPSPNGQITGNSSYAYHLSQHQPLEVAGGGGTISIVDSTNFPIAKTIAAAVVTLKPGALRELHWHPNVSLHIRVLTIAVTYLCRTFSYMYGRRLKNGSTLLRAMRAPPSSSAGPTPAHSTLRPAILPYFPITRAITWRTRVRTRRYRGSRYTSLIGSWTSR